MSNSSKQRAFINRAIFTLTQLGCKVTLELNKHYKIKIEKNSKAKPMESIYKFLLKFPRNTHFPLLRKKL